ncbi:MAG: response regulator [Verrucomicrobia bacterium]|nr:response regulator [Verrucomicrobiota bacterium]
MDASDSADRPIVRRPLVYIVDDEPVILELVARCLAKAGYRAATFESPVVACSAFALAEPKPDLLIVDYTMPEMDGLELLSRCRALAPNVKSLSVSGTLTDELLRDSEVRPDGCLRKPFVPAALLAAVRELLG